MLRGSFDSNHIHQEKIETAEIWYNLTLFSPGEHFGLFPAILFAHASLVVQTRTTEEKVIIEDETGGLPGKRGMPPLRRTSNLVWQAPGRCRKENIL